MTSARNIFTLARKGVSAAAVGTEAQKPFRFLLCGDPALVAELRALLLRGQDESVPLDAAATLETIDPLRIATVVGPDARCVIFLARPGDLAGARLDLLQQLKLPVFVLTIDPAASESHPVSAPPPGEVGEYVVDRIERETLRIKFFPHVIDRCKGH